MRLPKQHDDRATYLCKTQDRATHLNFFEGTTQKLETEFANNSLCNIALSPTKRCNSSASGTKIKNLERDHAGAPNFLTPAKRARSCEGPHRCLWTAIWEIIWLKAECTKKVT